MVTEGDLIKNAPTGELMLVRLRENDGLGLVLLAVITPQGHSIVQPVIMFVDSVTIETSPQLP